MSNQRSKLKKIIRSLLEELVSEEELSEIKNTIMQYMDKKTIFSRYEYMKYM